MQAKEVIFLFKRYLAAFKRYDLESVVACYHLPCTLNTPDKIVLLKSAKDCEQEFSNVFEQLQQANVSDIIASRASYSLAAENVLIACVDWVFIDKKNEIFADFSAIYHLILIENELRIINVVSHELSNSLALDYSFVLNG